MKKKTRRLVTLLLVVSLIFGLTAGLTAGANGETMDMDGDGRITIHDVQLANEITSGTKKASERQTIVLSNYSVGEIFNMIFGKMYTPAKDSTGAYKISTVKDLRFVRDTASKGYTYKLQTNIDLQGANWTPIDDFTGTFDGNNKTISNFVITKGANGSYNPAVLDMGFFSEIMANATVKNLNLQNAEVVATEARAQFIGLLCGTNRGTITGCYTHGKITDNRTEVTLAKGEGDFTLVAALVARNLGAGKYSTVSNKYATEPTYEDASGNIKRYTLKTASADVNDNQILIAAQLAVELADRNDITICLSYNNPTNSTVTQFQDISASWDVSEDLQDKQDRVVDYMVSMGQVKWKTPTDLVWHKGSGMEVDGDVTETTWKAGTTYYGLPFNGYHSGLERFQSVANLTGGTWVIDANLANEVKTSLTTTTAWYTSASWAAGDNDAENTLEGTVPATDVGYDGWIRYIGNDCSSACSWAWLQVSPVDAFADNGAFIDTCRHSFPYKELDDNCNDHYGHAHNLVQIGYYDFFETDDATGKITKKFLTATEAETQDCDGNGVVSAQLDGRYATTSANVWEWNADNAAAAKGAKENVVYAKMYEAYTQARKGDVMQTWFTGDHATNTFSEDTNGNGVLDTYHEDVNANGKLDEGEDLNGNGKLDVTEDKNQNGDLDTALVARVWEGHMRMLAEDPVAIRNRDGYLDLQKSYMITCEHGGAPAARRSTRNAGKTDGTGNSWGLWQKYSFDDLGYDTTKACENLNNSSRCYMPITCKVLRGETASAQKYSFTNDPSGAYTPVTAPYAGEVYTNYALAKATMYIYDLQGNLLYEETVTALPEGGARATQTQFRWAFKRQKRLNLTETFAHLKGLELLESGTQYQFQLKLESVLDVKVNGQWQNSTLTTSKMTFTHNPN